MPESSEKSFVYGVLLHLTHYDPRWVEHKDTEKRYDRALMEELIDLSADSGYNTVILDIADAVEYATHPELKRPYSVPMQELTELADRIRARGMEVIGKLNFAKGDRDRHNWWFRPYRNLPDNDEYFERAWQVIGEVLAAVKPSRRFHIGMDEDRLREAQAYCHVIETLYTGLTERGYETVMWNDATHEWPEPRKGVLEAAWQRIPREVVQMLWDYRKACPELVKHFVGLGFPVWGASGRTVEVAGAWSAAIRENGGSGLVATIWQPIQPEHREAYRDTIVGSARAFGIGSC